MDLILASVSPMVLFWIAALLIFAIAEAATVGLVSIWFAGGSLAALIAAGLNGPIWLQAVLFFAVSAILLAMLRPLVHKVVKPNIVPTNADRNIGRETVVTETIDNLRETGTVKLDGVVWTARSEDDSIIPEGSIVTVKKIDSVKLIVALSEQKEDQ